MTSISSRAPLRGGALEGKRALVTGSGRGIGRAIALAMAEQGADIVVNDLPGSSNAMTTRELIEQRGRTAVIAEADVSSPEAVDQMIEATVSTLGGIDILVNNACRGYGDAARDIFRPDPLVNVSTMPLDWWRLTIETCLSSAFYCSRAAAGHMTKAATGGKIINIGSIHGSLTTPKFVPYEVAKAGLEMLTKGLAVDLAPWKINVNCIAPGAIATEDAGNPLYPEGVDAYRRRIPWGARGFPEDVAQVAVFLASDAARYITGHVLCVDGGYTIDGSVSELKQNIHPVPPLDPDKDIPE